MNYKKYACIIFLMTLLLTACNAGTSQETPAPPSTPTVLVPTKTVTIPEPQKTEPVLIESDDEPALLSIKFVGFERVLPADMDIATQSEAVVSQYAQMTGAGSNLWAAGSIQDIIFFSLKVESVNQDAPELISATFPIQLHVTETDITQEDVHILSQIGAGGGRESIYFSTLPLQAGEFELTPDDPSPVILTKEVEQISYDFTMSCTQSGVFELDFKIPYTVTGNMETSEYVHEYTIQVICPETATLWYLMDLDNGQIENGGRWAFQGTHYVPLP